MVADDGRSADQFWFDIIDIGGLALTTLVLKIL